MKTTKINFSNISNELSREEMKNIMAGSGGCIVGGCLVEYMCCCRDGRKFCTDNCFAHCCAGDPLCV